ncbi:hypothetical protein ABBQ38_010522 [Trebouxia sp. C0009 RCD-2024]
MSTVSKGSEPPKSSPSGVAAAHPDQVVQYLLAHNYLLTALELLVEAQEAGQEDDVESLQRFFSDQAKFPAESVAKFDPSEAINIQQLARKREERLGVLEYELRVAKEDLAETQREAANRTSSIGNGTAVTTTCQVPVSLAGDAASSAEPKGSAAPDAMSPGDRALLNGALRAYLISQGYKLTALTLSEEGGSSIPATPTPQGPTLFDMLQGNTQKVAATEAKEASEAMQQQAKEEAAAANARAVALQDAMDAMAKEKARLRADMEYLQSQLDLVTQQAEAAAAAAAAASKGSSDHTSQVQASHLVAQANRTSGTPEAWTITEGIPTKIGVHSGSRQLFPEATMNRARCEQEDDAPKPKVGNGDSAGPRLLGAEAALRVVAEQLPKIVPNVLINKRDDVVPILLAVIQEHRNAATRDKLTHALFNLVKKPTAGQRHLIADSCADLAGRIGTSRTAEELLPQCWEQVNHRHAERRALVAETCGALALHVASDMRASLILSILQQMATDSDAIVRRATAQALAHLLPLLPDLHKFQAVQGLLLQLAKDHSQDVVDTAFEQLLPALLAWMADTDLLYTALLPSILTDLQASLERNNGQPMTKSSQVCKEFMSGTCTYGAKYIHEHPPTANRPAAAAPEQSAEPKASKCPFLASTQEAVLQEGQAELRAVNDHQQRQVQILLRLYTILLPNLRQAALQTAPSWAGGAAVDPGPGTNMCHDALAATIRREAAAVLNVGRVFHSEDEEVCVPTHAPPSVQPSIPDSPCSSSAPDTSTRLSTAHSIEEEDIRAPEAAPASSDSPLTHDNPNVMTASAPGHPPPSPSKTLQLSSTAVTSHPQQQQPQMSSTSLAKEQKGTAPSQQPVNVHPLQAEVQSAGAQEGLPDSQQAEAAVGAQALDQSPGAAGQWDDGGGLAGEAAFGCWASAAQHGDWGVVEWVACQALPALVAAVRMVSPHSETEAIRRRFSATFKATCLSFGQSFTADVVQPILMASAAVPQQDALTTQAEHLAELVGKQQCLTAEGQRVGRLTVLPILLSAVLPYAQVEGRALHHFLHSLAADGGGGDAEPIWVVQHIQEVSAALRFACAFQAVQAPVSQVMKALQAHDTAAVRRCAVACATALTPCLPRHQVMQQVLPTLERLSEDDDSAVQTAAIDGLAQLLPLHGSKPDMVGRLYSHFDELVTSNQPQIQLAVLQSLTVHVAQLDDSAMEFLLQKVLMVLTYLHRRTPATAPAHLHTLANACFTALRAADTCEVQHETVQLHLLAALQSLHREAELLPSTQREVLSAMLREHGAAAAPHAHATDASLSHPRRSFTTHSEGGGLAAHLVASSQPPPSIPRHSTNTTRRPSELGPAISGLVLC